jgi:hypothetical protein
MEFGLVTRFTEHLQIVTTSNCNSVTDLHTLYRSLYCNSHKVIHVFNIRCFVEASKRKFLSFQIHVLLRAEPEAVGYLLYARFLSHLFFDFDYTHVKCSSETSVDFRRLTRHYTSEIRTLHNHRCNNLISYKVKNKTGGRFS